MLRIIIVALAGMMTAMEAGATSLIGRDPTTIAASLSELFVASLYCERTVTVNHDVVDLVWDVHQLMTGVDPDSQEGKDALVPFVNDAEEAAKADVGAFCTKIVAEYGADGKSIAGLVSPR